MAETKRETYQKQYQGLKNEFVGNGWEADYRTIQKAFMPLRGRFYQDETNKSQKSRLNNSINNTGIMAVRTLRSGMMAGVTSPARPWFRIATTDRDKMKSRAVKEYLELVETLMREIFNQSNLYQVLPVIYGELGTFGTACMIAMPSFDDVVRFYPIPIGQFYLGTNDEYQVDTMARSFRLNAKQAMQRFNGKVSRQIKSAYDTSNHTKLFDFCHMIKPNGAGKDGAIFGRDMAYHSAYFESGNDSDMNEENTLSGFGSFPVMAPRWETNGEDVYGYGCGFYALGDNNQLQVQEKRKGQAIDKSVTPPLKAPASMKNTPILGIPGGVTYYDSTSPDAGKGVDTLYQVGSRIDALVADMDRVERRISRAFYEDLFLMLAQSDRRQITAREIDERVEEKLLMLGPVMESIHSELLSPIIESTYAKMVAANILPEPPDEIRGDALKVEFISTMAQAQKMVGIGAIERFIGFVGQVSAAFPEARHKLDAINAVDTVGDMLGVPQKIMRPDEDVKDRIDAENKQAQAQQAIQVGTAAVDAAKNLSEAKTSRGNILETLTGA